MNDPIALKWLNDGDWTGLLRGGPTSSTTCVVNKTEINGNHATITLRSQEGGISSGDAVQNNDRYYKVTSVQNNSFTLAIDSHFTAYQAFKQLIILRKQSGVRILTLESILQQLGSYTYLLNYLFSITTNPTLHIVIPPSFFYPEKHRTLEGFLKLIGSTLRGNWNFPAVVTGEDSMPKFVDQLVQISGVKMWQWVDKKLGKVLSVNNNTKQLNTEPILDMPCGAMCNNQIFVISRKTNVNHKFLLALEPTDSDQLHKGDLVRFYTSSSSMDWWNLPEDQVRAECTVIVCVGSRVTVHFKTGFFRIGDIIYADGPGIYTINAVEPAGDNTYLYLDHIADWPIGTLLTKQEADVRVPGKRTMPLIQKARAIFLSYTKQTPIRLLISKNEANWANAQIVGKTPVIGDIFHQIGQTVLYTIVQTYGNNIYFTPDCPHELGECEITQSTMDFACGITVPAYGEYFLSMHSSPLLYSNATFIIKEIDPISFNLIYDEGENWSPAIINSNPYCTHSIYKVGDYCYNELIFPRTMEHLTELLYEFQRLITAMWDQIQILGVSIHGQQNWIYDAEQQLLVDPYWALYYEAI
jgi:hypothetical protein